MASPDSQPDLRETALDRANRLARSLHSLKQDLSRVTPGASEGHAALDNAAAAVDHLIELLRTASAETPRKQD
jgi:hypothetical protein